ncbi:MAG TPA: presqualene diphosphate synthase HpnD [Caulobacteraceae bacterium]|nr:presqualene diphosphate synthase HpnD [Caulobacteraceae bacterium]
MSTASLESKTASTAEGQASGSSFYTAMRLLPAAEREAMFAIYDFCRKVDDIADEPGPTAEERRAQLDVWRRGLDALYAGGAVADRLHGLIDPVKRYGLAKEDFLAVIDGMEMDVGDPIIAPEFDTLDLYCDRVASAVGRLSVRIFGMEHEPGLRLAHHLGRALQFTNILRDIDEDAQNGRLYLPLEALQAARIGERDPLAVIADPDIDRACRWLAAKALEQYHEAQTVLDGGPGGRLRAPRLMIGVYGHILRRMIAAGWGQPRERVKVSKGRLAWIVLSRGLAR